MKEWREKNLRKKWNNESKKERRKEGNKELKKERKKVRKGKKERKENMSNEINIGSESPKWFMTSI